MDSFTIDVAAVARVGAACLAAPSPWTTVVAAGGNAAPAWTLALAAGKSMDVRGEAMTHRTAMSPLAQQHGSLVKGVEQAPLPQVAAAHAADLLPTTVTVNRKPNTNKTRISVGGYGAMGPHPERERLA